MGGLCSQLKRLFLCWALVFASGCGGDKSASVLTPQKPGGARPPSQKPLPSAPSRALPAFAIVAETQALTELWLGRSTNPPDCIQRTPDTLKWRCPLKAGIDQGRFGRVEVKSENQGSWSWQSDSDLRAKVEQGSKIKDLAMDFSGRWSQESSERARLKSKMTVTWEDLSMGGGVRHILTWTMDATLLHKQGSWLQMLNPQIEYTHIESKLKNGKWTSTQSPYWLDARSLVEVGTCGRLNGSWAWTANLDAPIGLETNLDGGLVNPSKQEQQGWPVCSTPHWPGPGFIKSILF